MHSPLKFEYDSVRDVLTVEGNRFAGEFFRFFRPVNENQVFRLTKAADGLIQIVIERRRVYLRNVGSVEEPVEGDIEMVMAVVEELQDLARRMKRTKA
jgi:hypothetical protein